MFIYLITNLVNGKYYVGQTARTPRERFLGHFMQARQGSPLRLHRAMRKYGQEAFVQEVLATAETEEQTAMLERLWIAVLNSMNFQVGYNASPGGDVRSKESAAAAGLKMQGENNPNFGKTMSKEQRDLIAQSRKGKGTGPRPKEVCARISATRRERIAAGLFVVNAPDRTGSVSSKEANEKRSAALKGVYTGERSSMFGRKHSEATIAKMKASHAARREALNG